LQGFLLSHRRRGRVKTVFLEKNMQTKILNKMCCPVCQEDLQVEIYEEGERNYNGTKVKEVKSGLLISSVGYIYPIVDGVPRIQLESFLDYAEFIRQHKKNYESIKEILLKKYSYVIDKCRKKNARTKSSFSQEWGIFNYEQDTTWDLTRESRKKRFIQLLNCKPKELTGKAFIDIGCGNGVLTSALSEYGLETFGLDVSRSVDRAYLENKNPNVHFLQGDLQHPPFKKETFDIVFSSGVLHHTNNTELSFSIIDKMVKKKGKLYVWLYNPIDSFKHRLYNRLRGITKYIPLKIQYLIYLIFLVPFGLLRERLKGIKRSWRGQLIAYLDTFSPEFRYEHVPEEVLIWFLKRDYHKPEVRTHNKFGFGICGTKK